MTKRAPAAGHHHGIAAAPVHRACRANGAAWADPGSTSALAAASPTTSPAVRTALLSPGAGIYCETGNFCASVWDPAAGRFRVFLFFYYCNLYSLANWNDWGEAKNSRTGGAVAHLYGSGGGRLKSIPADNEVYGVDWGPVHSLRNC
jgi:hypothetical protein